MITTWSPSLEVEKRECRVCKTLQPETLYASTMSHECVYCTAKRQDALPIPKEKESATPLEEETTLEQKARAELALRILTRKRLLPFVERFNPDYNAGWVHKDICRRLEQFSRDVAEKKVRDLCSLCRLDTVRARLRQLRSRLGIWVATQDHEFISCSYSGSLAMGFSRKVRSLLRDPSYKTAFKTRLDPDSQSAEAWLTTNGGGYVAAGVGGGITGKGAHVLVIDDPVKNREDAESANNREANWDWYTSTAYTRLAPGGGVLVILTRWHDDDLAGKLLSAAQEGGDEWTVVKYPAIAEENEEFRSHGEALHPERYDVEALQRIQRAVGPRDWSALYQQESGC